MVDLKAIVDIEKIRESKGELRKQRILNATLSGWEEMSRYISSMEEGILDIKNQIEEDSEYFLGQIDILQMLKSFISNRVELISPDHPLVQKNER